MHSPDKTFHTFRAATLNEAYCQMRNTLGENAVMLRATQVREGGVLGLLGSKMVELTAAVDDRKGNPAARKRTPAEQKYVSASKANMPHQDPETLAYFKQLVLDAQRRMGIAGARPNRYATTGNAAPKPVEEMNRPSSIVPFPQIGAMSEPYEEPHQLRNEVREIREILQVLVAEIPGAGLPIEFAPHYRNLIERGVSRKVAAALVAGVLRDADFSVIRDPRIFAERLRFEIRKRIVVTGGISLVGGTCRVVALVGATGVGKTTTLAKLAARFVVRQPARVAFITTDTYRIAAAEQLRVYANIYGVPLKVVNDGREMASAIREFRDCDLVLIDTAGASQFNVKQTAEAAELLKVAQANEVMLVLSANTQLEELVSTVWNFRGLNPTSVVFSKLDETRRYGAMLSLTVETGLPLSYFSTGQNVPDDIQLAHPGMVSELVLEGGDNRGRSSAQTP